MVWHFFRRKKQDIPAWYAAYLEADFSPASTTIEETVFVALDCETTGLSANDQLISAAAVKCTSNQIHLTEILDQKYPFQGPGKSAEIHGELSKGVTTDLEKQLKELLLFINNHVIVGHNIAFDIGILNHHLKKIGAGPLKNKWLDTARMSIRLDPEKYERTVGGKSQLHLDDLCEQFQIPIQNRHTALGDAYMTALLFQRLLSRLKARGITNMKGLLR